MRFWYGIPNSAAHFFEVVHRRGIKANRNLTLELFWRKGFCGNGEKSYSLLIGVSSKLFPPPTVARLAEINRITESDSR